MKYAAPLLLCFTLLACTTIEPLHKFPNTDLKAETSQIVHDFVSASAPSRGVNTPGHEIAFNYLKKQFEDIAAETIKAKGKAKVIVHEFDPDVNFAARNYQNDFDTLVKDHYLPKDPVYKKWNRFTHGAIENVRRYTKIPGRNLILELTGRRAPSQVIYVGAHYDTIIHDATTLSILPSVPAPGADDNASAIAAMLVMARELSKEKPDRTIRFVAFDFEEIFFLGSYALAKDLNSFRPRWMRVDEQTVGLLNLEMIGYSTKKPEHPVLKLYTREKATPGAEHDNSIVSYFTQASRILKSPLDVKTLQNGFNRSDNWSFWQKSFPAICITQDWESDFDPHYHTSEDTPENLNYSYLGNITTLLTEVTTEMAHITQQQTR